MAKAFKGGLGKRAETELHPSRARTGTEPWLAFARLFTGRFFWGCVRRSSFASTCCARDGCTPQNRWKMRFFTEGWRRIRRLPSLSVAFRRFATEKIFSRMDTKPGKPGVSSFKFQVPSSKPERGGRWSAFVHESPPLSAFCTRNFFCEGEREGGLRNSKTKRPRLLFASIRSGTVLTCI